MNYETLLDVAFSEGLIVKEKNLLAYDGRIKGNRIAIRKNFESTAEKACVLAEELGHHYTTSGNILDLADVQNRKQECCARLWAYNKMIGLSGIVSAYNAGCKNTYEMAEHLNVSESFLQEALVAYRTKYGLYAKSGNHLIYFEPVLEVHEIKDNFEKLCTVQKEFVTYDANRAKELRGNCL